ncbi:hypothetical protein M0R04_01105 [Candidatus Dojkabacteria bacterium]|jgi:hypothetical protein|nr:hypothetical protein [Candidatus Dojkabacteria bacterium]
MTIVRQAPQFNLESERFSGEPGVFVKELLDRNYTDLSDSPLSLNMSKTFYWKTFRQTENSIDERFPRFINVCNDMGDEEAQALFDATLLVVVTAIIYGQKYELTKQPSMQIASAFSVLGKLLRITTTKDAQEIDEDYVSSREAQLFIDFINRIRFRVEYSYPAPRLFESVRDYDESTYISDSIIYLGLKLLGIDLHRSEIAEKLRSAFYWNNISDIQDVLKQILDQ